MLSEQRIQSKAEVHVTMTVLGAGGKVLMRDEQTARIVRVRPNGPKCEPVCFQVPVAVDASSLKLTETRQSG